MGRKRRLSGSLQKVNPGDSAKSRRFVGLVCPARVAEQPSLVPPSSAVPTAADKQQYDDDDQKSCGVHIVLLKGSELGVDPNCFGSPRG